MLKPAQVNKKAQVCSVSHSESVESGKKSMLGSGGEGREGKKTRKRKGDWGRKRLQCDRGLHLY